MKIAEIMTIKQSLEKLGEVKLPIAFEVAKNIRACNKVIEEAQSLSKELFEQYVDKDDNGKIKTYRENGQEVSKVSDPEKFKELQAELLKLDQEDHEIKFTPIDRNKLVNATGIDGKILVPLLDIIISEE